MGCSTSTLSETNRAETGTHASAASINASKRTEAEALFRRLDVLFRASNLFDAVEDAEDRRALVDAMERVDVARGEILLRRMPGRAGQSGDGGAGGRVYHGHTARRGGSGGGRGEGEGYGSLGGASHLDEREPGPQAVASRHEARDALYIIEDGEVDLEVDGEMALTLHRVGSHRSHPCTAAPSSHPTLYALGPGP